MIEARNSRIRIRTDEGTGFLKLRIALDNEDPDEAEQMLIKTEYEGMELIAAGSSPFEEAYAKLQGLLPKGVKLIGCVSCAHGNLCPVGNYYDEVFCTKDLVITCKSDLYFPTEDAGERARRLRLFTDYCEDFREQESGIYTYNLYNLFLENKE